MRRTIHWFQSHCFFHNVVMVFFCFFLMTMMMRCSNFKHVLLVKIPVSTELPQVTVENHGGHHFLVSSPQIMASQQRLQLVDDARAMRQEEGAPRSIFMEIKQLLLHANLPMVMVFSTAQRSQSMREPIVAPGFQKETRRLEHHRHVDLSEPRVSFPLIFFVE